MKVDIKVKDFGKIKEANIKIRRFTLVCGPNSSGKSFLTKAIYSFLNSVNKDYLSTFLNDTSLEIENSIKRSFALATILDDIAIEAFDLIENEKYSPIQEKLKNLLPLDNYVRLGDGLLDITVRIIMEKLSDHIHCTEYMLDTIEHLKKTKPKNMEQIIRTWFTSPAKHSEKLGGAFSWFFFKHIVDVTANSDKSIKDAFFDGLESQLHQLKKTSQEKHNEILRTFDSPASLQSFISSKISATFKDHLKENFQIPTLQRLIRRTEDKKIDQAILDFDMLGAVEIRDDDLKINIENFEKRKEIMSTFFVESPIYWKIKDALEIVKMQSIRQNKMTYDEKETLSGVPQYVYELFDSIAKRKKATGDDLFSGSLNSIDDAIGGKITITDAGDFYFSDADTGYRHELNLVAQGIVNLGMLSLLCSNNMVGPGSVIILDEPEINLHPKWQRVMIESLFDLSKRGVNIVLSTHSPDIIMCVHYLLAKNKELIENEHISANYLKTEGVSSVCNEDIEQVLSEIIKDLSESFADMSLNT